MSRPTHLGVLCVDVNELLRAHNRLKVKRRDNMLLYRKSYLITDPLPPTTTPHSSVGKRTPSNSPSRNSNAGTRLSRKSSTCTPRRHRGSRRRSSSSRRKRGDKDQSDNDSESGAYPLESEVHEVALITSGVSTPKRSSSKIDSARRKPYKMITATPEEEGNNCSTSVSGWHSKKRISSPLQGSHDGHEQEGLETSQRDHHVTLEGYFIPGNSRDHVEGKVNESKMQDQERPGEYKYSQDNQTEEKKQKEQEEEEEEEQQQQRSQLSSSDPRSSISESAQRTINSLLASMQQRVWENAHKMRSSPLGSYRESERVKYGRSNYDGDYEYSREEENNSKTNSSNPENSSDTLHVTMVGPMGVGSVPPSPNPWSRPRIQSLSPSRRSPIPTNNAMAAICNTPHHHMLDKNGKERVLVMGVVPTIPKPVVKPPLRAVREGATTTTTTTTTLPPVFRRVARVAAAPSRRPKRF
ncbi:uncharacterized protein TM35_000023150 [Trypanosoma theileri]|uniref:Uncharacterized protein n=1 Tax=Trypanosoma theileri TaxID=67003 RepID=A0A1X0P8S4_9TRYP|nr:uncharacterized protein TM35_000023150 [Trypanosoma theileri]ORC92989.1 hypothetical protein TM35_000023150 [Trypanosoma theileri]